jgi:single-strand DNA-binding protein
MASLNKVLLMGNLTRDPELRYTPGGAAVCTLGVAMNRRYTTARGEDKEEVCFVDVEAWGKWAEACGSYLRKGAPVFIEGRLRYDQWEDRDTGKKRSRLVVTAERGQFLGQPSRGGESFATDGDDSPGPDESRRPPRGTARRTGESEDAALPKMPPFDEVGEADDDIPF